jgi:large subunit ribosomal protein L18
MEGSATTPRLAVFKSNRYIYAQAIDDIKGVTLASATSLKDKKGTMLEKSFRVGEEIAKALTAKKVGTVVFDRGGFLYTGNVKAVAEGARKGGLNF